MAVVGKTEFTISAYHIAKLFGAWDNNQTKQYNEWKTIERFIKGPEYASEQYYLTIEKIIHEGENRWNNISKYLIDGFFNRSGFNLGCFGELEQVIIEGGKYDAIEEYKNEMIWKTGHNKKLSNITGMSVYTPGDCMSGIFKKLITNEIGLIMSIDGITRDGECIILYDKYWLSQRLLRRKRW